MFGRLDETREKVKGELTAIDADIKRSKGELSNLEKERKKLLDPTAGIASLRDQIIKDAILSQGKYTDIAKELMRQKGSSPALRTALGEAGLADTAAEIRDATKALDDYVASVERLREEAGKSAHEVALMNAARGRVSAEALEDARRNLMGAGGANLVVGSLFPMLAQIEEARKGMTEAATVRGGFNVGGAGVAAQMFGGGPNLVVLKEIALGQGELPAAIAYELAKKLGMK